ncbi:MAG: hypothetical protein AB3A66_21730 [Nodularia sp. CChRGM 3473]
MTKNLIRIQCPRCYEWHTHRNGWNPRASGEKVQKWYCQECDRSFQEREWLRPVAGDRQSNC